MTTEARSKWLTIMAAVAVGVLVVDRLVVTPFANHWKEQTSRIRTLRDQIEQGEQLLEREEALSRRWKEMTREAMPEDSSAAEQAVIQAAARWAAESRLTFTSLIPNWREYEGSYQTLEWRGTGQGDLPSIARFLQELEQDPLAVRLETFEVTPADERGRSLQLRFRFSALRLPSSDSEPL